MNAPAPTHPEKLYRVQFSLVSVVAALLVSAPLSGCSSKQEVKSEEGLAASQRAAQADVAAQTAAGEQGVTASSIPNLVPGEGRVQLPPSPAAPATAPTGDNFDNDNPGHLLARCRDRAGRREWFDAVGDCRRSYELDPTNLEPQFELMRILVTLQSYGEAEMSARRVLAANPNDTVALYYLAWSHRGRDEFPAAIAALERAIALEPKRVEYVYALGITYCLSDNYGRGIATLEKAQSMKPGDEGTKNAIASARALLAEKLEPYRRLVREKPDSYDNRAALGFKLQTFGFPDKALLEYDSALAKIPTPIGDQDAKVRKIAGEISYNRGEVYRAMGKCDGAEPAYWQAMQLDKELEAFAWYRIGECRYDAGKLDASIEALRRSIDLAPDVADNREALASAYLKAGKADLAQEQSNTAKAIRARLDSEKAARKQEHEDEEAAAARTAEAGRPAPPPPAALPPESLGAEPAAPAPAAPAPAATAPAAPAPAAPAPAASAPAAPVPAESPPSAPPAADVPPSGPSTGADASNP